MKIQAHTSHRFQATQLACMRGDIQLFEQITFDLQAGEALLLSGSNGSGKSSLLRLLSGLSLAITGEVAWNGVNIKKLGEDFYQILLFLGHASALKNDLTALENVLFSTRMSGKKCSQEQALSALQTMALEHIAHLPASALSQGQRKRVALARVFIAPLPALLILDEPFAALDQQAIALLCSLLNVHLAQGGILIYTTHQKVELQTSKLHLLQLDSVLT